LSFDDAGKLKNVLIISYFFPPNNRVGGRRWAKFAKYLTKNSCKVYVLAGGYSGESSWDKDTEPYKENIYRIKLQSPSIPFFQKKLPGSLLEKIVWKLSYYNWIISCRFKTGNYKDHSFLDKAAFYERACEIIETKKIENLILTVGPFRFSSVLIDIKKKYPDLNIVIDYRDYREDGWRSGGFTKKQIEYEKKEQIKVLKEVHHITTVNEEISGYFRSMDGNMSVSTVPHCYDTDDLNKSESAGELLKTAKSHQNSVRCIYGGELYEGMEEYVRLFSDFLLAMKEKGITISAELFLQYKTYGHIIESSEIRDIVNIHKTIPLKDYFNEILTSDFVLLFRPSWSPNAQSSKFFELVALRKPILYFGPKGGVSDFIEKNRLGYFITKENLKPIVNEISSGNYKVNVPDLNFNIDEYSFESSTKQVMRLLK
jgi:hypothetical protein